LLPLLLSIMDLPSFIMLSMVELGGV
jgi:hypothetical protein